MRKLFYRFLILSKADYVVGFLGRRGFFSSLTERLAPPVYYYDKQDIRKIKILDVSFVVQMNDLMSQPLFFGLYMDEILCLKSHFPPNAVVIDVGANIGRWSLLIARLFKTQKVFSFEPFLKTYFYLAENISLNISLNIETFNLALNNKNEFVSMSSVNEMNSGMNFISLAQTASADQVQSVTLDDFLFKKMADKIDVIKIDVEGFEMNVLQGAAQTIEKHHPVIICEIDDQLLSKNNTTPQQIFDFFISHQYQVKRLPHMEDVLFLPSLDNIHFDIIALPYERSIS